MRRPHPSHDSLHAAGPGEDTVRDTLFGGAVPLLQPRRGYRVNVDALVLGAFAAACRPKARHLVDLGAGVGAVSLAYARFGSVGRGTLVEREPDLALLAEQNLASAGVAATIFAADLTRGLPPQLRGVGDVVVSNPPFFPEGAAASLAPGKRKARSGALEPFLRAASAALGSRAYAFFVYPAAALPELLEGARAAGLVCKRLRFVHPFAAAKARLALVELRRGRPGGLVVLPPLVEWAARGVRSPELAAIVSGERP